MRGSLNGICGERPMRKCRKCGDSITDILTHPYAHMCEKCRFVSRTAAITTQPGVSSIELITDILRAEGWPKYVNPRTIAIEHAREFSGTGIATTVGRVMPRIVCDDGDRYVKYNCTVYKKVTL